MSWLDDFGEGFKMPLEWAYNKAAKLDKGADKVLDGASNLLDIFTGNSNILIYLGIGIVAVAVLPTLIEKFL